MSIHPKIGQPFFERYESIFGVQCDRKAYEHGIFCSGSRRYPRGTGLGNGCSCHSIDLWYNRLGVSINGTDATRTIRVAVCPSCQKRTEFPFISEAFPREVFCMDCNIWAPVEVLSWTGTDFAKLLPVFPR